jgi:hypothetical protein
MFGRYSLMISFVRVAGLDDWIKLETILSISLITYDQYGMIDIWVLKWFLIVPSLDFLFNCCATKNSTILPREIEESIERDKWLRGSDDVLLRRHCHSADRCNRWSSSLCRKAQSGCQAVRLSVRSFQLCHAPRVAAIVARVQESRSGTVEIVTLCDGDGPRHTQRDRANLI